MTVIVTNQGGWAGLKSPKAQISRSGIIQEIQRARLCKGKNHWVQKIRQSSFL